MRILRLTCLAALAFVVVAGCSRGPATGEVQGKVTFKGQPVKEGTVTFINNKEGGMFESSISPDGSYRIPKAVVGDYVVEIKPLMVLVDTDPGKSPPAPTEKRAPDIPMKYRQQGSTPLKVTVKEGLNEQNFDMQPR